MSDFVIHKGRHAAGTFARHYGTNVDGVHYEVGEATKVVLADGRAGAGTCLGCGSPPCIEKDSSELALYGALDAFPGDPSRDVCPTRAIAWDGENSSAIVIADECIGCGLCIIRCPYGAISLRDGLTASVDTVDRDGLAIAGKVSREHDRGQRSGQIAKLDAPAAKNLPAMVEALSDAQTSLLVRNLLHEVGLNARTRRRGDNNMRIDVVGFSRSQRPFVAEIETGAGVLESPRALLEDVAVLHSRYGYAIDEVDPVSIILLLPSLRSEYYQVIRDIEKVLGLRCRTITVGSLVALLWHCRTLDNFDGDAFALSEGAIDIADSLNLDYANEVEPYPGVSEPYPGTFRPAK